MSKVYRYLLQVNHVKLVTLEEELKFIQSYYHLLKTRFGQGIFMTVDVDASARQFLIPPLTLQLLVENAVKHNKALKEAPLQITVSMSGQNWLQVQNNLQCKTTPVESHCVGLKNISDKYKLMGQPDIIVEKKENLFRVSVPLIRQEIGEAAHSLTC